MPGPGEPPGARCSAYDHSKGCAIIGGYVYRGSEFPDLVGRYLFGDLCSGTIWDVPATATSPATPEVLLQTGLTLTGFGEDAAGELYLEEINGGVYHLVSNTTRVSGADRYATSAAVAGLGGYATGGTVYLAVRRGLRRRALGRARSPARDHAPLLLVAPALPVPASDRAPVWRRSRPATSRSSAAPERSRRRSPITS